jgi:hypothetical protein
MDDKQEEKGKTLLLLLLEWCNNAIKRKQAISNQ